MFTLLKNLECYCPRYCGKNDILISYDKIIKIQPEIGLEESNYIENVILCDGLLAFPGIIDQHVHILGGGGEQGFISRVGEIDIDDIFAAGVTTLVGLLGADGLTKSLESLLAKAKSLESQGLTTFIYSGSYSLPAVTFTQNMMRDLVLIDKVIGAGEIAISDHRSSQPSTSDLQKLASDTHLGGLIGGKAGVVHFHVGDGKTGLAPLINLLNESDLPIEQFVPTHVNRNPVLFKQAIEYCRSGGNIDLTAGETAGLPVPEALKRLLDSGMDVSRVTVSSDANGSIPEGGVGKIQSLYDDIKSCIVKEGMNPETAFQFVTENVAKILNLHPKKGTLSEDSDADILIMDKNYNLQKLFCMGKMVVENGRVVKKQSSEEVHV
jgi:beta-aspartyl-dipeptidase (metallo-type)